MRDINTENFKYYEFCRQEYYALIKVSTKDTIDVYNKSFRLYVELVGGETITEVKLEGSPVELTEDEALLTFLKASKDETVGYSLKQFEAAGDTLLLVDAALI
jgi:hypothetical protein